MVARLKGSNMYIALYDVETGDSDWRGPLADFLDANADSLDAFEIADIQDTLASGSVYFIGGGAAAEFRLERVAP